MNNVQTNTGGLVVDNFVNYPPLKGDIIKRLYINANISFEEMMILLDTPYTLYTSSSTITWTSGGITTASNIPNCSITTTNDKINK